MMEVEKVSYASAFAAELEGKGVGTFRANLVPVSFRLSVDQVAAVDAFAEVAGKSRTYVFSQLLEVALERLREEVDKGTQQKIRKAQAAKVRALLEQHGIGDDYEEK
jgi:predicted transcriptional regulator